MKSILFLCVANSTRSQMAEGLARQLLGSKLKVQSAGFKPAPVDPYAVRALEEFKVDISAYRPKTVAEIEPGSFDTVIYMCAEEACPLPVEGVTRLYWQMADPAATLGTDEHILHAFRATRDKIYMKLKSFEKELLKASAP
jgi:arsenate reductase